MKKSNYVLDVLAAILSNFAIFCMGIASAMLYPEIASEGTPEVWLCLAWVFAGFLVFAYFVGWLLAKRPNQS